jgi:hypothetical protein
MSLSARFANARPSQVGNPCGIGEVLKKVSAEDADVLEAVLAISPGQPGRLSNKQIRQILEDEGHVVALASVILHRRQECRCFRGLNPTMVSTTSNVEFVKTTRSRKSAE